MATTLQMCIAIGDKLIDILRDDSNHDVVKLFIRGFKPTDVPIKMHPFYEVVVLPVRPLGGLSGHTMRDKYDVVIKANTALEAKQADWVQSAANRKLTIPSQDRIVAMVMSTVTLLRRQQYTDLEGLQVEDGDLVETVTQMLVGDFTLGIEDARDDNFTNVGTISLTVDTIIRGE